MITNEANNKVKELYRANVYLNRHKVVNRIANTKCENTLKVQCEIFKKLSLLLKSL